MTSANHHPSDEVLSDFAQGKLSTGMSVALSAHIELCQSCRQRSSELESREIVAWLQADQIQPNASPDFSGMLDLITSQPQMTGEAAVEPDREPAPLVSEIHMLDHSITLPRVLAKAASKGLVWHKLAGGINQEPGAMPGEGLTALQTFTYFFAAPIGLFLGISLIVWALTGDKKKSASSTSVVTHIE